MTKEFKIGDKVTGFGSSDPCIVIGVELHSNVTEKSIIVGYYNRIHISIESNNCNLQHIKSTIGQQPNEYIMMSEKEFNKYNFKDWNYYLQKDLILTTEKFKLIFLRRIKKYYV